MDVINAWGRILSGSMPLLSIEITRECPLTCPGCYAYNDTHLGGGVVLRRRDTAPRPRGAGIGAGGAVPHAGLLTGIQRPGCSQT